MNRDSLSKERFDDQMARIIETFGKNSFTPERIRVIWRMVQRLSFESFIKIVETMICNLRYAPLPKDFADAVTAELKNAPREKEHRAADPVDCDWCLDSGVHEAIERSTSTKVFIRCACDDLEIKYKKSFRYELPAWTSALAEYFERKAIDHLEWKPNCFDPEKPTDSLNDKAEVWRFKVKMSQEFWSDT